MLQNKSDFTNLACRPGILKSGFYKSKENVHFLAKYAKMAFFVSELLAVGTRGATHFLFTGGKLISV